MIATRRYYFAAAWLMPLAVLSQIGLALFGIPLVVHTMLGILVGVLAILLARLTLAHCVSRSQRLLATLLVGLIGLQPWLIALRQVVPLLASVHEINAFAVLAVSCALALDVEEIESDRAVSPTSAEVGGPVRGRDG